MQKGRYLYVYFTENQKDIDYLHNGSLIVSHINLHKAITSKIKSEVGNIHWNNSKNGFQNQKANKPDGHGTGQASIDQW